MPICICLELENDMDKIYIIDAVNYLFRAYYAIGPMTNPQGQSTSALYGFIRSVEKILKDFSPENIVCVFDGPDNKKLRREIYSEYKANREKGPEDFYPQIELAIQWCKKAGLPLLIVEGFEADDTMASVCLWAKNQAVTSYLCTSDKDLMQLVDENTFVLNAHKNNLLVDRKKVEEMFGVSPTQILDLLALMGDSSDNIPGVEGIGPKTAASLLQKFNSLEQILDKAEEIGGKKGQTLLAQRKQALMSKDLATLIFDVPFPKEHSFFTKKEPDFQQLKEFYQEMRFLTLLKELDHESNEPKEVELEKKEYILIDTEEKLQLLVENLKKQTEIVVDTETTFDHPLQAKLVGFGFCVEKAKAYYIPFVKAIDPKIICSYLSPLFASPSISFVGHNIKFDVHVLNQHGLSIKNIGFDTMIASYVINPQNRRHNLDQVTLQIFEKKKIPIKTLIGEGRKKISMEDVPLSKICEYCCEDVDYTFRLKEYFSKKLEEKNLESVFYDIEIPLLPILVEMEENGMYLDVEKLSEMSKSLELELKILAEKIHKEVGRSFNINSPKQLSEALYKDLGLKPSRKKGAETSTAAHILEEIAEENPIVSTILEYRGLEKLRSTYTQSLADQVNSKTNRIHCTFNQSVAATGRLSCSDPNLQNIPVRSERGRKIREGFKPEKENWVYLSFDYSQIELRLLAHFSEDMELVNAFNNNEDIHAHTASIIFDLPICDVTKKMRNQAKTVNFGLLYGQGPFGLAKQLGISTKEAKQFIEMYFSRYKKVKDYFDKSIEEARKLGFVKTITGRIRPLLEINNKNMMIRSAAERLAINSPLQGTNADIIKKAMISIDKDIKDLNGFLILQIHDELLFEVPNNEIDIFKKIVKEKMEHAFKLKIPLAVDIAVGKNWGEC